MYHPSRGKEEPSEVATVKVIVNLLSKANKVSCNKIVSKLMISALKHNSTQRECYKRRKKQRIKDLRQLRVKVLLKRLNLGILLLHRLRMMSNTKRLYIRKSMSIRSTPSKKVNIQLTSWSLSNRLKAIKTSRTMIKSMKNHSLLKMSKSRSKIRIKATKRLRTSLIQTL